MRACVRVAPCTTPSTSHTMTNTVTSLCPFSSHRYERPVKAGEILIREGDTGLAAQELYVVKAGEFEIREQRKGVNLKVRVV